MTAAREWRYRRAITAPCRVSTRSSGPTNRRGLHRVGRTGWSYAVGLFAASTILGAASPASASSVGPSRLMTSGCGCAASSAAAGGIPASPGRESPGNGNGNAYGHDRGQSTGVLQGQPTGLGGGNGQDNNSAAAPLAPAARGGGHQPNGAASHGQGGQHGHQGNGPDASPQHAAGPGHADKAAPGPPPWAASRRASASRRVATTPAAVSPGALTATAPPATGDSSAAQGQAGRAPRIARRRSSSARSRVRRRRHSASSQRNNRVAAALGARARRAGVSGAAAPGATGSPGKGRSSGTPAKGRTQPRSRTGTAGGEGFLSLPLALPRTIERLVRVVPSAVWLALLAAIALAAAAGAGRERSRLARKASVAQPSLVAARQRSGARVQWRSGVSARARGISRRSVGGNIGSATPSPSAVSRPSSGCVASDASGGAQGASASSDVAFRGIKPDPATAIQSRPSPDRACTTGRRRGIAHSYILSLGNPPTRARATLLELAMASTRLPWWPCGEPADDHQAQKAAHLQAIPGWAVLGSNQ